MTQCDGGQNDHSWHVMMVGRDEGIGQILVEPSAILRSRRAMARGLPQVLLLVLVLLLLLLLNRITHFASFAL